MAQSGGKQRKVRITSSSLLAVVLTVLMLTGTVTPVLAAGYGEQVSLQQVTTAGNDGEPNGAVLGTKQAETLFESSPNLQKKWAQTLIRNGTRAHGYNQQSLEYVNRSLQRSTGPSTVTNASAFDLDAKAVKSLELHGDQRRQEMDVLAARLIVSADNETAAARIAHARWALNHTRDRLHTGVEKSSEAHIRNSERAYERAEQRLDDAAVDDMEARAAAIRQYRVAWIQATKALQRIDEATKPVVVVETRGDPQRNGSEQITGEVRGHVFDADSSDLETATVTVGQERTKTVPLNGTGTHANATFAVNVTLDDRITQVNVSVAENGTDAADSASEPTTSRQPADGTEAESDTGKSDHAKDNGKSDHAKDNGKPDHAKDNGKQKGASGDDAKPPGKAGGDIGYDVVLFDGDGLPDTFETEVLGTDPQDPDSDSPKVRSDVGDNGVIDGLEDFDGDNVTNYHEGRFGTDPFSSDTDDDGLPDEFEIEYGELNPRQADTDDDGVRDDEWDTDDDGLTNEEEYEAGTNPQVADIDRDGLNDSAELEYGTNASDPDTDDDGLTDGEEIRLGTDPLSPDSNGDGVADGNATYTTTATNGSLGVSVDLSGNGDIASGVSIENTSEEAFDREPITDAQVTPFVNLESSESFESANVTFSYDESDLNGTNESDLVVFRYNESLGLFEPLNTSVDAANDTVTGETAHFSRFVVFDVRNWAANYAAERPEDGAGESEVQPIDVTLIIDSSGSMGWNDPREFRKQASKEFVGALVDGDRAGVVDFDDEAEVTQELTTDFGKVNVSIERLDADGGTNIGAGVRRANEHFAERSNDSRAQFAILLTDGQGGGGRSEARTAAERGTTIYTIGFGDADGSKLSDIAETTGGNYTYVDDASDLPDVFSRVAEDVGAQDTDGDGLADVAEQRGIPTTHGLIQTDPYDNDTDDDGLTDREELGRATSFDDLVARLDPDSGASEPERRQARSIVQTMEAAGYNLSNVSTKIFLQPTSDPTEPDTDGDNVDDYTETTTPAEVLWTPNQSATQRVLETGEPTAATIEDAYERNEVYSDPWLSDTDGDGLNDSRERELATDPTSADTDGDGIDDDVEAAGRGDPTLYDVRPPEIEVSNSGYRIPSGSLDTTYWVSVRIEDSAGVANATLVKGEEELKTREFDADDPYLTDDGTLALGTLEYTDKAVTTEEVDTSSATSTFVSFGSATVDAAGDLSDTFADVTLGATVYVRANDENANSRRVVGVQRENFYSAVAGELYTGTILDYATASEFGKVSGFSASLGVFFKDVATFIDDPTAFVDGMQAMYRIITERGVDVIGPLIDGYIEQFEQKQARNNPYGSLEEKEHPELYDVFEANWYEGYAAGFLSKTVLSAGAGKAAKTAIKQTDTATDVAQRLADTRALRALSRMSDAKEAGKARVAARILLASDDATESVISQADTAGQAVRLWRIQRNMDADVDALSEAKQARLGKALARGDADTSDAVRRMDQDALDDLTGLDVDPRVRAGLAPKYAELDAAKRQQLTRAIEGDADAAANVARLDTEGTRDALEFHCGSALPQVGAASGLGTDRFHAVQSAGSGCTVQTDFKSKLWQLDGDLRDGLDRQTVKALQDTDLGDEGARYLQRSGDVGGQKLLNDLADADDDRLESFLTFRVRADSDGASTLAGGVRRSLTRAHDNGDISSKAIGEVSRDIDDLARNDQVRGLDSVLADDVDGIGNWNNMKGALYEIRIANQKLVDELDDGDELVMGYKPNQELDDFDYDDLTQDDIEEIAEETGIPENQIEQELSYGQGSDPDPEFDGFVIETDQGAVYYEAKSGDVSTGDIEKKTVFLKGLEKQHPDISTSEIRLVSRLPRSNDKVTLKAWDYLDNSEFGSATQFPWEFTD